MFFIEEVVDFKEEKNKQKINIKENKKIISKLNNLIDTLLSEKTNNGVNQTFVISGNNCIFYFRKINKFGKSYYSIQKQNKENDYQFEYFYGNAMVNTTKGIKTIKSFKLTHNTIDVFCYELKELFSDSANIMSSLSVF